MRKFFVIHLMKFGWKRRRLWRSGLISFNYNWLNNQVSIFIIQYGYIIKVIRLIKIVDNYISNVNSELIFIVEFEAETIKPEINSLYEDEIFLVLRGGIFFHISNKFKVLIPPNSLCDYTFNADNKSYVNKNDSSIFLVKGIKCKIKITGIRYMNKKFDCFGELVEIV